MAQKVKIEDHNLTQTEFEELVKASRDVFFFAKFIFVVHPLRGRVPFHLYPYQEAVLYQFLTNRFNIILKFRQAGITELISMYCLWLAMYFDNKNIVMISIKERVARKILKRIKNMYKLLPPHLQVKIVNGRVKEFGTTSEMEFSNGSLITSVPTTEEAGRSEAVSLLVIDEAAVVRWANQIWAASFPTLSTGGSAIINSCVTGDTEIVGKHGNFRIDTICPKEFGKMDISGLGIQVLSHTGHWRKVLGSVNKGQLETWEVIDDRGKILKCTPAHKLYTPEGWTTVKDIIQNNQSIITYDTGISKLEELPITLKPEKEELREVVGFPNYMVSNLGKVYVYKEGGLVEKKARLNNWGYRTIALWHKCTKKKIMVSKLVASHFIGKIPPGFIVDHINCNKSDDYITNLQIITLSQNAQRAVKYSRGLTLGNKMGDGFANIKLIGQIRQAALKGELRSNIADNLGIPRSYVTRTLQNIRVKGVQISQLKLVRKYSDTIFDICVEEDESYITNSGHINHNTPYGIGNWFHSMWVNSFAGGNGFNPIRLKWPMHPERDIDWYKGMALALGPRRTAQEVDGDFLSSGNTVFNMGDIRAIEEELSEFTHYKVDLNGQLYIHKPAQRGERYFIGADVASGRARDYSAFTIMNQLGEEFACFKGKVSVGELANLLMRYGKIYNNAVLAPESNDIGMAVTMKIQESGYRNLYYSKKLLRKKGESRAKEELVPGWITTNKTRPTILSQLEEDIRMGELQTYDPFFIQEAYTFIYDDQNRPVAMGKGKRSSGEDDVLSEETFTDDAIMAKAITNFIRKGRSTGPIILPI